MAFESFADEMKGRVERMGRQTQDVFNSYLQLNRRAYGVVLESAQSLAKAELENARHFCDEAFDQFNEARVGGLGDMMMMPARMAPAGRRTLGDSVENARKQLLSTREEMSHVLKEGYQEIWGKLSEVRAETKTASTKAPRQVPEVTDKTVGNAKRAAPQPNVKRTATKPATSTGGKAAASPAASGSSVGKTAANKRKSPTTAKRTGTTGRRTNKSATATSSAGKTAAPASSPSPATATSPASDKSTSPSQSGTKSNA